MDGTDETIRVNLNKIETLMAQADELLVSKISSEQRLVEMKRLRTDLEQWRRDLHKHAGFHKQYASSNGNGSDRTAMLNTLGMYQSLIGEFSTRLTAFEKDLNGNTLRLGLVTSNLQDGIRQVRMLPFHTILGGFRRMVRDLSRELDKDVNLEESGTEIELDKKVLEEIRDPLMHLLRNAIAHGIETPEEREALRKPRQGTVTLEISHQGNLVKITVADDGRGLDLEAVRKAAIKARVMDRAELEALPEEQLSRLILLPGITTSKKITGLSGRGVGMDVVRQKIDNLHGGIDIDSQPGEGASFQLTVPVSLATTHGLLVQVQDETYALPLASVEKIISVSVDDVQTVSGREMIAFNDVPIALVRLDEVLEYSQPALEMLEVMIGVVLKSGATRIAFVVDDLLGEQEMVVKRLGRQLTHVRNVSGATLLGTGQVVIILNPQELVRSAQKANIQAGPIFALPTTDDGPASTILVVDDSITTRTLEKNILEAAGYKVITAIDGIEAVTYLRSNGCDLVVSDIQMPRMNGFELTQTVKSSDDLGHLPLILVTSLESQDDRERGLEAGADAYIVKSAFDQDDLLATIRQLL
jgi:two-component system chemotaxis sensor kinase CheA